MMRVCRRLVLLLCSLMALNIAFGNTIASEHQPAIALDRNSTLNILRHAEILNTDASITDPRIALTAGNWRPLTEPTVRIGADAGPQWLRVGLTNIDAIPLTFRLDTDLPSLLIFDVWQISQADKAPVQIASSRHLEPYSDRPLNHHTVAVELTLGAHDNADVLVRVAHQLPRELRLRLLSPRAAKLEDKLDASLSGAFHGIILGILLLALTCRRLVGGALCAVFAAYLLTSQFFILSWEQHLYRLLFANARELDLHVWTALFNAVLATQLLFGRRLFSIGDTHPLYSQLLLIFAGVNLLAAAAELLPLGSVREILAIIELPRTAGSMLLHFCTAILAFRSRHAGAVAFVLTGAFISLTIVLRLTGVIQAESMLNAMRILFLCEALAFGFALLSRALQMMQERDDARAAELNARLHAQRTAAALTAHEQAYNDTRLRADRYASQLASVRHDIAQPLTALRVALQQDNPDHSRAIESLNYLEQLAQQSAINQSAPAPVALDTVDLNALCDQVHVMFRSEAQHAGCTLTYHPMAQPQQVEINALALMRVLSNLVSNAIRHANAQVVSLSLIRRGNSCCIEVNDDGIGMPADVTRRVLSQEPHDQDTADHGLGLRIVQENCEDNGFTLTFESEAGHGTSARVRVALPDSETQITPETPQTPN